mgnify:CR=1 FL=1
MEQDTLHSAILSVIIREDTDDMNATSRKMKYLCDCQSQIAEAIGIESLCTEEWDNDQVMNAYNHIELVS